jgi:hypothetical protein
MWGFWGIFITEALALWTFVERCPSGESLRSDAHVPGVRWVVAFLEQAELGSDWFRKVDHVASVLDFHPKLHHSTKVWSPRWDDFLGLTNKIEVGT